MAKRKLTCRIHTKRKSEIAFGKVDKKNKYPLIYFKSKSFNLIIKGHKGGTRKSEFALIYLCCKGVPKTCNSIKGYHLQMGTACMGRKQRLQWLLFWIKVEFEMMNEEMINWHCLEDEMRSVSSKLNEEKVLIKMNEDDNKICTSLSSYLCIILFTSLKAHLMITKVYSSSFTTSLSLLTYSLCSLQFYSAFSFYHFKKLCKLWLSWFF